MQFSKSNNEVIILIEYVKGDFFDYKANIRINTVNCVGVMGAGVALEFKTRYPEINRRECWEEPQTHGHGGRFLEHNTNWLML